MRILIVVISIFIIGLFSACTQHQNYQTSLIYPTNESRPMLINWHDPTYRSYYGVRGKVKSLTILFDGISGEKSDNNEWLIEFDTRGRLSKKTVLGNDPLLESFYRYKGDSTIKIISKINNKDWRTTEYNFNHSNELVNIRYVDNQSKQYFEQIVAKYDVENGWFRVFKFVNGIDGPHYRFFNHNQELIWSSKDVTDNGADNFLLSTADGVTSATVENAFQQNMRPIGGYVYEYNKDGRLSSVTSFNSNNNGIYHVTSYIYNSMGLLQSESKEIIGKSLFNDSNSATVVYHYDGVDTMGNWLERTAYIKQGNRDSKIVQRRKISYY